MKGLVEVRNLSGVVIRSDTFHIPGGHHMVLARHAGDARGDIATVTIYCMTSDDDEAAGR